MDVLPRKDEAVTRSSYGPNWFVAHEVGGYGGWSWTAEENKKFENALAKFDGEAPDRWAKVAAFILGKTVGDVINHYRELVFDVSEIEAGGVPCPEGWRNSQWVGGGKRSGARSSDHERKKGVPWTEEEHNGIQLTEALHLQIDVQMRLHEQLEKKLQLRIEAQSKKLQKMIEEQGKPNDSIVEIRADLMDARMYAFKRIQKCQEMDLSGLNLGAIRVLSKMT